MLHSKLFNGIIINHFYRRILLQNMYVDHAVVTRPAKSFSLKLSRAIILMDFCQIKKISFKFNA